MRSPSPAIELCDVDRTPEQIAAEARLTYVHRNQPGWERRRCGRGFTYLDHAGPDRSGVVLRGPDRARAEELVIPPAWTDVWICADPTGHLQAAGKDDQGRWQYLYHPDFRTEAERIKYLRLGPFGFALERLRRQVAADLTGDAGVDRQLVAAAVRLIDRGLVRVGHDAPQDPDDAVGATTLSPACVDIDSGSGRIELEFIGKAAKEQHVVIVDQPLAQVLTEVCDPASDRLFAAPSGAGGCVVSADDVNRYLLDVTGQAFTAKDFRTWGGTVVVARHLARTGPSDDDVAADAVLLEAVDLAAERLGNTRAVARASYVSPAITDAHRSGLLDEIWRRTRSGALATRPERTVIRLHLLPAGARGRLTS